MFRDTSAQAIIEFAIQYEESQESDPMQAHAKAFKNVFRAGQIVGVYYGDGTFSGAFNELTFSKTK